MKIQKAVRKETLHIALGTAAMSALMCIVFAVLGKFSLWVLLGALFGTLVAVLNFFLLGLSVQKAMDKGEDAARYMKGIYSLRMMGCALCIVAAILAPCFDTLAAIIPLFFPQLVILIMRALGLVKDEAGQDGKEEPEA